MLGLDGKIWTAGAHGISQSDWLKQGFRTAEMLQKKINGNV